ncbi:hypothetical protein [Micromonospora sp. HUAS LYJ1]|uniref:hypothetical protein n=1 Tax=Micromonospora sp. HUAS LYJ1 TaxID=3061626 RepID=UPI0026725029|nr:hypothetical protein [Micromonospora sp. HUAS LYJ1]WKU08019.1 hypothetical protein Q2K16_13805 [Micromonospora sp. HUAS LYJ1]
MRLEQLTRALRDLGCVTVGLGVIVHQTVVVPPGRASEALLVAAVTLLTGPAVGGVIGLRREANTSAGSSSPSSPSSSPSPSSPSAAPSGAGDPG